MNDHHPTQFETARSYHARVKTLIDLVEEGIPDRAIAERFGWSVSTVARWRRTFQLYKRGEGRRASKHGLGGRRPNQREARP